MLRKAIIFSAITLMLTVMGGLAVASDYQFIAAEVLNQRIAKNDPIVIIDICPVAQYQKGHVKGAIETNAYPVKTDAEKASLARYLPKIQGNTEDVVIICPRGAGGAKRTYDYYKSQGVDEKRLFILEKGMGGWPYETEPK